MRKDQRPEEKKMPMCKKKTFVHSNICIHGGLTPALAPGMPVITEDVLWANQGRKCDTAVLPRGTIKNKSPLNEEKENTGIRFNEPATNLNIRHTMTNRSRKQQHCCSSNNKQQYSSTQSSSSNSSGRSTLCAYKTDLSIAQTTP